MRTVTKHLGALIDEHTKAIEDIKALQKTVDHFVKEYFQSANVGAFPIAHDFFLDLNEMDRREWDLMEIFITGIRNVANIFKHADKLSAADVYVSRLANDPSQFPRKEPIRDPLKHAFVMMGELEGRGYRLLIAGIYHSGTWDKRQVDLIPREDGTFDYH